MSRGLYVYLVGYEALWGLFGAYFHPGNFICQQNCQGYHTINRPAGLLRLAGVVTLAEPLRPAGLVRLAGLVRPTG